MKQLRRRKYHEWPDTPHIVYRLYNSDGDLIYVGVTRSFAARFNVHVNSKPWFPQVVRIELTHVANALTGRMLEAKLLTEHHPKYNKVVPDAAYILACSTHRFRAQRPRGQALTCAKCDGPRDRPPYCRACRTEYQKNYRKKLRAS